MCEPQSDHAAVVAVGWRRASTRRQSYTTGRSIYRRLPFHLRVFRAWKWSRILRQFWVDPPEDTDDDTNTLILLDFAHKTISSTATHKKITTFFLFWDLLNRVRPRRPRTSSMSSQNQHQMPCVLTNWQELPQCKSLKNENTSMCVRPAAAWVRVASSRPTLAPSFVLSFI